MGIVPYGMVARGAVAGILPALRATSPCAGEAKDKGLDRGATARVAPTGDVRLVQILALAGQCQRVSAFARK